MSEWIPVAKKLPPPLVDVIVAYRNLEGRMTVDAGYLQPAGIARCCRWQYLGMEQLGIQGVEYWMPLPEPPAVEVEG